MKIVKRDITTVYAPAFIAHGVNAHGVMGSGVAKALFEKWPEVKESYLKSFKRGEKPKLGELAGSCEPNFQLFIANLVTQEKYGYDGKRYADPEAIERAMIEFITSHKISGNPYPNHPPPHHHRQSSSLKNNS